MKNLLIASLSALALLASGNAFAKGDKPVKTKSGHLSKAHQCTKDGAEIKTSDKYKGKGGAGQTIRREKTCKAEGGEWTPVNAPAKAEKTEKAPKHKKGKHAKAEKADKKS
jgi:hypothetical protein